MLPPKKKKREKEEEMEEEEEEEKEEEEEEGGGRGKRCAQLLSLAAVPAGSSTPPHFLFFSVRKPYAPVLAPVLTSRASYFYSFLLYHFSPYNAKPTPWNGPCIK